MSAQLFIVDTFTAVPFKGNPTGVCCLTEEMDFDNMLLLAKELSFPVTAFVQKVPGKEQAYYIHYFTPATPIPACGHATLGAAAVLMEKDAASNITFHTASGGCITALFKEGLVAMMYPPYEMQPAPVPLELLQSMHLSHYQTGGYCPELETWFIELEDPAVLRAITPDYPRMVASVPLGKEVVVTCQADTAGYDFLLRSFCPWIGIDEDPVTGSVHSVLAGFWKSRLHKNVLQAFQASPRGGEISLHVLKDKVEISGACAVLLKGDLKL